MEMLRTKHYIFIVSFSTALVDFKSIFSITNLFVLCSKTETDFYQRKNSTKILCFYDKSNKTEYFLN